MSAPFRTRFDASLYAPAWLSLPHDEVREVQPSVAEWLAHRGFLVVPLDAGARHLRGRARGALAQAGRHDLIARVMRGRSGAADAGTPDLFAIQKRTGRALLVECKAPALIVNGRVVRPAGTATKDQIDLLTRAAAHGALAGIAWGTRDLPEIVGDHR